MDTKKVVKLGSEEAGSEEYTWEEEEMGEDEYSYYWTGEEEQEEQEDEDEFESSFRDEPSNFDSFILQKKGKKKKREEDEFEVENFRLDDHDVPKKKKQPVTEESEEDENDDIYSIKKMNIASVTAKKRLFMEYPEPFPDTNQKYPLSDVDYEMQKLNFKDETLEL